MRYLLGVDAGGSKTLSVITDAHGTSLGVGMGGPGNFQGPGVEKAREGVKESIDAALADAGITMDQVAAAYCGMAGADRDEDFRIVHGLLEPLFPTQKWDFENDATIGIWAGTGDGVGVGVICGTGTNVIGFNANNERVQVGGMGYSFGDYAGGSIIGSLALRAAMRGFEGRGPETVLYERLLRHYGLEKLIDLVDWQYEGKSFRGSELVPIVFEAAEQGDAVARQILTDVGEELGVSANAAIRKLFGTYDPDASEPHKSIAVVAIGSIFQSATYPLMYDAFVETMRRENPLVAPIILQVEPVFGAVYAAAGLAGISVDEDFKNRLIDTFPGREAAL